MRCCALLAGAAAVAALVGCGGSSQSPAFQRVKRWHVLVEPGQIVSAANVPFAAADRSQSAPTHTVAALPHHGIVIWVQWQRRGTFSGEDRQYPREAPPLRVMPDMAPVEPEGFACPQASSSGCSTRADLAASKSWDVAFWVFFGTAKPSRGTVAAANAELARLRFS
jgi:hypothetical protein